MPSTELLRSGQAIAPASLRAVPYSHGLAKPLRRVVLVAGGTAGHVYPALAVADAYKEQVPSVQLLFFGTPEGFEATLVPRYGYPLELVRSRPIFGENLLGKVRTIAGLGGAVLAARQKLTAAKADLVIGFGGYASVPTILAARSLGLPTAIHECNAVAGLANRLLGRFVDRIYLGFEAAATQFDRRRVVVTGNPVRPDVAALAGRPRPFPAPGHPLRILVTGGSQGSSFLNRRTPPFLKRLAAIGVDLEVLHQSGSEDCHSVSEAYRKAGLKAVVTPFIDDMAEAYSWADFAIACSGASTMSEVAVLGLPVLLVPLPTAANNHQASNLAAFAQVTGVNWQTEWAPDALFGEMNRLLHDEIGWRSLSQALNRFARREASRAIIADCEAIIDRKMRE